MSERTDKELLYDIREALDRITYYVKDMKFEIFLNDIKTQDAVIRNIEIIGEAIKYMSAELKNQNEDIPWKKMAGMRDKMIHFYFGVNWDIVWSVITDKLPVVKEKIELLVKERSV
jgi:uncharacterized protein with HEPN domain